VLPLHQLSRTAMVSTRTGGSFTTALHAARNQLIIDKTSTLTPHHRR
jgi:hypothetical protein